MIFKNFKYFFLISLSITVINVQSQDDTTANEKNKKENDVIFNQEIRHEEKDMIFPKNLKDTLSNLSLNNTLNKDSVKDDEQVINSEIKYKSKDSIIFVINKNKVYLYGEASIKYENISLDAEYIDFSTKENTAYAKGVEDSLGNTKGKPNFKEGESEFISSTLRYNFKTKKGYIVQIATEQDGGYLHSDELKKRDDNISFLRKGKYTTCELGHPHYYIHLTKAKVIPQDKIVTKPAWMVIEDFPIYAPIPFGFFPNTSKYSSGILIPVYGTESGTSGRGYYFQNGGYYWAASPYYDVTIRGDIYTNGSWGTTVHSNYRSRYQFSGNLDFRRNVNIFSEAGLPDYKEVKGTSIRWTHTQDPKANPYRNFSASVNISTSSYDYYNAKSAQNHLTNQKASSISYSKQWAGTPFSISSTLRHSQNSQDSTISLSLPEINFNMTQVFPFRNKNKAGKLKWYDKIGLSYSANLKNSITNIKEKELLQTSLNKEWKSGIKHAVPLSGSFKLMDNLTFSPSVRYTGIVFNNYIKKYWEPNFINTSNGRAVVGGVVTDTIGTLSSVHSITSSASLTYNPKLYGIYQFSDPNAKIKAIRHVISTSLGLSYTPELGLNNDKYNREYLTSAPPNVNVQNYSIYSTGVFGLPSGTKESASITFNIDNNVEMKLAKKDTANDQTLQKIKLIESLSLNTSYSVFKDSLNLNNISISARTTILKKMNIRISSTWDPYAFDDNGRKYNVFEVDKTGKLMRLTSAAGSTGLQFSPKKNKKEEKEKAQNERLIGDYYDNYVDFDVPWNVSIDFSLRYAQSGFNKEKQKFKFDATKSLNFSGTINLTPKTKIGFTSGWNFETKKLTYTTMNLYRDLHCFSMSMNLIPFGDFQSYNFTLNIKSSLLKDLKLEKKNSYYENF